MRRAFALLLSFALLAGCRGRRPNDEAKARDRAEGRHPDGTSPRSRDDRIAPPTGAAVGSLPGHVEGALAYASVRVGALQAMRAELRGAFPEGVGLDELLAKLDPDARISLSLRAIPEHGVHLRVHIPSPLSGEPGELEATLRRIAGEHAAINVQTIDEGARADLLLGAEANRLAEAVELGTSSRPETAALVGDATVLVDGPAAIAWASTFGDADTLERLRATERLVAGVSVELELAVAELRGRVRWLPTTAGREALGSVFELDGVDADVPTIAALCRDALICARSRGLPAPERFAGLATGIYADPGALVRALEDHPFEAAVVLGLETWPNAIASTTRLSGHVEQNALAIGGRALGFGFRQDRRDRWFAYARTSAGDLDALRGFLELADSGLSPVAIAEVDARIESGDAPSPLPGRLYAIFDPPTYAWGWAALASDDDAIVQLTRLDHDDGAVPIVYVETSDLERALANGPFAWPPNPWMQGRRLRAQLGLGDHRAPELRFAAAR